MDTLMEQQRLTKVYQGAERKPALNGLMRSNPAGAMRAISVLGSVVAGNDLSHLAEAMLAHNPGNCFTGNTAASGHAVTTSPVGLERWAAVCSAQAGGTFFGPLGAQIACATGAFGAYDGISAPMIGALEYLVRALHVGTTALRTSAVAAGRAKYPPYTAAEAPRPPAQPTLPDPCGGAPANDWCS